MTDTFEQGWAARGFGEQFPELSEPEAKMLDSVNRSITDLNIRGIITYSQANNMREKRFPRLVSKTVLGARERIKKEKEQQND